MYVYIDAHLKNKENLFLCANRSTSSRHLRSTLHAKDAKESNSAIYFLNEGDLEKLHP